MANYSDIQTEKKLKALENKIKREYRTAYEGMRARYDEYMNGSDEMVNGKRVHHLSLYERLAKEEEAYKAGKYTDLEWKMYKKTQIQRGERYRRMVSDLALRISDTNKVASAYINDTTPSIYSLNANYQAYEIGRGLEGVSFTMYDEATVRNMIDGRGNYTEFRTTRINPKRDYEWNTKQINSAVTSAILQGKPVDKLADSMLTVMKRNRNSAVRNARTAITSAQNGGRISGMRQAKAQGINVRKKWLSAHDGRVRDTHAILDGQIRDIEDAFDNGLLFPADSGGVPHEVYNCRCTLTYIYPEYDDDISSEIYRDESLEGESFPQFVKRMSKEPRERELWNVKKSSDWKSTTGKPLTNAQKTELYEYAKSKDVRLLNLRKFDGDVDLLKAGITTLSDLQKEFGYNNYTLEIGGFADDNIYGSTTKRNIKINNLILRDREITENILKANEDFASESIEDIFRHEYGHIIDYNNKLNYIELAQKAYYNVFNKEITKSQIVDYLEENVSLYSIIQENEQYIEITSELGILKSRGDLFSNEYMRLMREK